MRGPSHPFKTARRVDAREAERDDAAPGASVTTGEASRSPAGSSWPDSADASGVNSKGLPPSMNTLGELVAKIVKKSGSEK